MEASFFLTSKAFNKTLDLLPPIKPISPIFHTKRLHPFKHPSLSLSAITCSGHRPQYPDDDDREPSIGSDWRSFRARLVSAEQSLRPRSVDDEVDKNPAALSPTSGDRWAHRIIEPERGCLLVATEKLDGVHIFERTVVLLLSTSRVQYSGVILNRPSLMSIKETRPTGLDVGGVFSDRPLFFGGPLEDGLFLVGPRPVNGDDGGVKGSGVFEEVMEGLYYGGKESVGCAAEMVKRGMVEVGDFRFFDGYCGWEREQLRDEIRAGYWRVVACSPTVVGPTCVGSSGLWDEVLGLVGERKVW